MDNLEMQEIIMSVVAIAFAFALMQVGGGIASIANTEFFVMFPITLVTVGLGFVLHELAHRYVARSYGAYAVYRAWPTGLLIMLGLAVLGSGFLFAAPGAVYIYAQYITRKENGIISVAGPMTNVALGLIFAVMSLVVPCSGTIFRLMHVAFVVGFQVNIFLALFNMIPMFPLDGSKVFAWDKGVWGSVVLACIILLNLSPVTVCH
ncbi:MAG: site-2 protease family protein [Candidatus Micrarchaeota archaeon]